MGPPLGCYHCSSIVHLSHPPVAMVRRPPEIEIIRRAYELWELSGKPEGRDQDFYLQALQELQTTLDDQAPGQPE
jgi:Protein of unknown function (DUF2934)